MTPERLALIAAVPDPAILAVIEEQAAEIERLRHALCWAAFSLDSYDRDGGGRRDVVEIAELLGFDGSAIDVVDWLLGGARNG